MPLFRSTDVKSDARVVNIKAKNWALLKDENLAGKVFFLIIWRDEAVVPVMYCDVGTFCWLAVN